MSCDILKGENIEFHWPCVIHFKTRNQLQESISFLLQYEDRFIIRNYVEITILKRERKEKGIDKKNQFR